MPRSFSPQTCRSCSPATTTSCRPTATSIRPSPTPKDALLQPESRARFARLLDQGWVDAIRTLHPDEPMYTFWDYMRNRWPRDAGLRIDHLLLSRQAAKRLVAAGVDRDVARQGRCQRPCAGLGRAARCRAASRAASALACEECPAAKPARGKSGRQEPAPAIARRRRSARTELTPPPAAGHRRRFVCAPRLSRAAENHPAARATGPPAPSSASPICCCGSTARSSRARCWSAGTRYDAPTYRHEQFPAYQSGREFDDALIEQLEVLPRIRRRLRLRQRQGARATRPTIFSPPRSPPRSGAAAACWSPAATATRFQLASDSTTILYPVRAGEVARIGPAEVRERYGVEPDAGAGLHRAARRSVRQAAGRAGRRRRAARRRCCANTGRWSDALKAGRFPQHAEKLRLFRSIATMNRKAPLPRLADQTPTWAKAAALARDWELKQLAERLEELARPRVNRALR